MTVADKEAHELTCPHAPLRCPSPGCGKRMRARDLGVHLIRGKCHLRLQEAQAAQAAAVQKVAELRQEHKIALSGKDKAFWTLKIEKNMLTSKLQASRKEVETFKKKGKSLKEELAACKKKGEAAEKVLANMGQLINTHQAQPLAEQERD
jgi:hypothetical protein